VDIREQFNQRMTRVSEKIDLKTDPFANLFSTKAKRNGRAAHSKLSQRLRRARMEKMDSGAKLKVERRTVHARPPANKSRPAFQVLWIPAGVVSIAGLFAAGFLGAKLASGGFKVANQAPQVPQVPVAIQEVQTTRTSPSPGETLLGTAVSTAAILQTQRANPAPVVKQINKPLPAPVTKQLPAPKTVELAAVATDKSVAQRDTIPNMKTSAGTLLDKGHLREQTGDFPAARNYFQQAFENGSLAAALAIGRSFDPRFVSDVTGTTQMADAELARKWYEKWYLTAVENGEVSSRIRFDRLVQGL